jgi:hypothetical protein
MRTDKTKRFYEVSFILEQNSPSTEWIADQLQEGLNQDEYIDDLSISEIPSSELEVH